MDAQQEPQDLPAPNGRQQGAHTASAPAALRGKTVFITGAGGARVRAIRALLLMPPETVIAEPTVLPMRETSWP